MVEEEIKKMIEEDGKEREAEGVQSRKKRGPMAGDWQGVQCQCESVSLFIPNVSQAPVWHLSPYFLPLFYLGPLHSVPSPYYDSSFPSSIYWELARSRILRS